MERLQRRLRRPSCVVDGLVERDYSKDLKYDSTSQGDYYKCNEKIMNVISVKSMRTKIRFQLKSTIGSRLGGTGRSKCLPVRTEIRDASILPPMTATPVQSECPKTPPIETQTMFYVNEIES